MIRASDEADALAGLFERREPATAPAAPAQPVAATAPATGARPWIAIAACALAGTAGLLGGLFVAEAVAGSLWPANDANPATLETIYSLAIFGPILAAGYAGGRLMRSPGLTLGGAPSRALGLGAAIGGGGLLIAVAYAALAGSAGWGAAVETGLLLLAAGTVLMMLQVAAEEVLLRGWLQPVLAEHWHGWVAVAVSAALFAGLHLLGGVRTPLSLLNLMLGGILFGLLALRTGGLAAPLAAHYLWNWSEMFLFGLDPNPGVGAFGALLNLDLAGPALWGGNEEGLNSSLALTFAVGALIAGTALWRRRQA